MGYGLIVVWLLAAVLSGFVYNARVSAYGIAALLVVTAAVRVVHWPVQVSLLAVRRPALDAGLMLCAAGALVVLVRGLPL